MEPLKLSEEEEKGETVNGENASKTEDKELFET
jgi:hypothetical protein